MVKHEKGYKATTWRFGQGDFRGIGWVHIKDLHGGWLFGKSRKDERTSLDDPKFKRPMSSLFMATTTRKILHIYRLG